MTKNGKTIALLLALGGVCSLTSASFKYLQEKDAERVYHKTLTQAASEASHARLVCRLSQSNQELERLREAIESDEPAATYKMLSVFPLDACVEACYQFEVPPIGEVYNRAMRTAVLNALQKSAEKTIRNLRESES